VEQRDEQEIETRLRAAFLARSELVTHQTLRPGVPPNAHTAAKPTGRRGWGSVSFSGTVSDRSYNGYRKSPRPPAGATGKIPEVVRLHRMPFALSWAAQHNGSA